MGLFDKLRKKKQDNVCSKEEIIECYDAYGRKILISKDEWKNKILPDQLKKYRDDDNALYNLILSAIDDGFINEVVESAEHLKEIDRIKERGYTILSIVYMKLLQYDKAEKLLLEYIDKYKKTGTILTNLAKVYYGQGNEEKALEVLWDGIYLDPNQTNGLIWLGSIYNEKEGRSGYFKVLEEASKVDGSWFPQLLKAKEHLNNKNIDNALKEYESIMDIVKDNGYALSMISGDLGASGYADVMVRMIGPIYDLNTHGIDLGMNLLRGYLETKDCDNGEKILSELMKLERPDLKNYLMEIYNEFEKIKEGTKSKAIKDISISLPAVLHPLWSYSLEEPNWVIPNKAEGCKKVVFLSYANVGVKEEGNGHAEKEDPMGRLTRALPLYLGEKMEYETEASSNVLVPVIDGAGLVVSSKMYDYDFIKNIVAQSNADYLVTGGIKEDENYIYVDNYIYDNSGNKTEINKKLSKMTFGSEFNKMVQEITDSIHIKSVCCGKYYKTPKDSLVSIYINSLSQLLSQSMVKNKYISKDSLWGERNILNWYLNMAIENKEYPYFKFFLLSGISTCKEYGSEIYLELKNEVITLLNEKDDLYVGERLKPLAYKIYDMNKEFNDCKNELLIKYQEDKEYTEWLSKLYN